MFIHELVQQNFAKFQLELHDCDVRATVPGAQASSTSRQRSTVMSSVPPRPPLNGSLTRYSIQP